MSVNVSDANPMDYFARIVATFKREEAVLLNKIAARAMNNFLYLLAKAGSKTGELDAIHMQMFWERLEQDLKTIRQLQTGHAEYVPEHHRNAGLAAVAEAIVRSEVSKDE